MSSITDMVIFTSGMDDEAMVRLNAWCAEHDTERGQQFEQLDTEAAGGTKIFTSDIWAMAGNYFPYWELAGVLNSFGWRYPDDVVLVIDGEYGERIEIVRPTA